MANIEKYNNRNYNRSLDKFFDDFFSDFTYPARRNPLVDVEENKDNYVIKAEVPGFDEKNISLYVENHVLHIKGEYDSSENEKEGKGRKYLVRERRSESFERAFTLPEGVNESALEASYDKGVLTVTVPKAAKEEPKRIEVKLNN